MNMFSLLYNVAYGPAVKPPVFVRTMASSPLRLLMLGPLFVPDADLCQFLQRGSIACYAKRCTSHRKSVCRLSVCPSVRPSVTVWHCVETTQAKIMGSSLEDSPMTLVSHA